MKNSFTLKSGDSIYIEEKLRHAFMNVLRKIGLSDTLKNNIWNIPFGRVGKVVTDELDITVQPSIDYLKPTDYLRLALYRDNVSEGKDDLLSWRKADNLSEVLLKTFMDKLERLAKVGIPRKYHLVPAYDSYQIGITNYETTYLRYLSKTSPAFSNQYETMSIDYPVVEVIKAAYNKIIEQHSAYKNANIIKTFRDVEKCTLSSSLISRIESSPGRNMVILNQTFELAKFILLDMNIAAGFDSGSVSLLINANDVFEKFVVRLLKGCFPKEIFEYHENSTIAAKSSIGKEIESKPDILFRGVKNIVIDAKNKDIDSFVSNQDFYQVVCYCKSFNAETAILIYPDKVERPKTLLIPEFDKTLKIYVVSVDITKSNYTESQRAFADFAGKISDIIKYG